MSKRVDRINHPCAIENTVNSETLMRILFSCGWFSTKGLRHYAKISVFTVLGKCLLISSLPGKTSRMLPLSYISTCVLEAESCI